MALEQRLVGDAEAVALALPQTDCRASTDTDASKLSHVDRNAMLASDATTEFVTDETRDKDARCERSPERLPSSVGLSLEGMATAGGNAVSQSSNGYTGAKDTSTLDTPSSTGHRLSTSITSQNSSSLLRQPSYQGAKWKSVSVGAADPSRVLSPQRLRKKVDQLATVRDVHGAPVQIKKPNYGRVLNFTEEQRHDEVRRAERLNTPFVYPAKTPLHTTPCSDALVQRLARPRTRSQPAAVSVAPRPGPPPSPPHNSPPAAARRLSPSGAQNIAPRDGGRAKTAAPPHSDATVGRGRVLTTHKAPPPARAASVERNLYSRSAPRDRASREREIRLHGIIAKPRHAYFGPSIIHDSDTATVANARHSDAAAPFASLAARMNAMAASRFLLRARSLSAAPASKTTTRPDPPAAACGTAARVPPRTTSETVLQPPVTTTPPRPPRPPLARPADAAPRALQHVESIVLGKRTPVQVKTRRFSDPQPALAEGGQSSALPSSLTGELTAETGTMGAAPVAAPVYAIRRASSVPARRNEPSIVPCDAAASLAGQHDDAARQAAPPVVAVSRPCPDLRRANA